MDPIREIDHKFREIANVISLLNMVTLGHYGPVDDKVNHKILQGIHYLKKMLDDANIGIQDLLNKEKELLKMKDEFTSNVNHELRTPLTSILGTTDYLLDVLPTLSKEDIEIRLKRINRSGQNLLNVVNQLLDFSKIEAGNMDSRLGKVDLNKVFESVKDTFQELCDLKTLKLDIQVTDIKIINDYEHLHKVILNLLSNAYKFTEEGSIVLEAVDNGDDIQIIVSDTGQGIEIEDQQRIFKRFSQGSIQNNKAPGTGIGLHIVQNIVEMHGGSIVLESQPGMGSTFFVTLPVESALIQKADGENHGKEE